MPKSYRKAIVAIILNAKSEILIGYSPRDGSYKLPQGGMDFGETIEDTAKRELLEELDYNLTKENIIKVFAKTATYTYPVPTKKHIGQTLHILKIKHDEKIEFSPQDDEFEELLWISPKHLKNYNTDFRAAAYEKVLQLCGLVQKT